MNFDNKIKNKILEESNNYNLCRSKERQTDLGEVFTPTELVLDILSKLPDENWDDGKTFLDPTCGNGQFLSAVLIIKKQLGHLNPIATIFGVDIMKDNIKECRTRLLKIVGNTEYHKRLLRRNIVCKNGLEYDYDFKR